MNSPSNVMLQYVASKTLRCHTVMMQQTTNLAEHSFGVAMLCDYLSYNRPSATLLRVALYHDLHEQYTGDVPHPAKQDGVELRDALKVKEGWYNRVHVIPDAAELDSDERRILKTADMLEFLIHCYVEIKKGNNLIYAEYNTALKSLASIPPCGRAQAIINNIAGDLEQ